MQPVYEQLRFVLGHKPISILVPRIWFQVSHPFDGQNMAKTKPFRRQKRRFLGGARFQDFWLRRAAFTSPRPRPRGVIYSHIWTVSVEIALSFRTLPSLKSALQNHEGPTETRKGHSAHGQKGAKSKKNDRTKPNIQSPNHRSINQSIDRSINESTSSQVETRN